MEQAPSNLNTYGSATIPGADRLAWYNPRAMEQPPVTEDKPAVDEFEPGVHLSVADGFRFGCGFVLALIGFYFAVIVIAALVLAAAGLLGTPISLPSLMGGT